MIDWFKMVRVATGTMWAGIVWHRALTCMACMIQFLPGWNRPFDQQVGKSVSRDGTHNTAEHATVRGVPVALVFRSQPGPTRRGASRCIDFSPKPWRYAFMKRESIALQMARGVD